MNDKKEEIINHKEDNKENKNDEIEFSPEAKRAAKSSLYSYDHLKKKSA